MLSLFSVILLTLANQLMESSFRKTNSPTLSGPELLGFLCLEVGPFH